MGAGALFFAPQERRRSKKSGWKGRAWRGDAGEGERHLCEVKGGDGDPRALRGRNDFYARALNFGVSTAADYLDQSKSARDFFVGESFYLARSARRIYFACLFASSLTVARSYLEHWHGLKG